MSELRKERIVDDTIINEALRIVEEANCRKILLRILGAVAVAIHSEDLEYIQRRLKRLGDKERRFTDVDFAACSRQYGEVRKLFEDDLKYTADKFILMLHGRSRLIYYHPSELFHVDIFFDRLEFSHDIIFCSKHKESRLTLDLPTVPLADLVLEKTQIHHINEKDIKDIIILLLGHEIGDKEYKEIINAKYIAQILADDWGLWHDARTNLDKVKKSSEEYLLSALLTREESKEVIEKVNKLLSYIDEEEKMKRWRERAKKGTGKSWWREVEEVTR